MQVLLMSIINIYRCTNEADGFYEQILLCLVQNFVISIFITHNWDLGIWWLNGLRYVEAEWTDVCGGSVD